MRSFKWQALFAAAMFAVPSITNAQSEFRVVTDVFQNQNENQNVNVDEKPELPQPGDPFYAVREDKPRVDVKLDKRIDVRPRIEVKRLEYTNRVGRTTDSSGVVLSNVPPAMAAQLRLQRNVGLVVEQLAPGSALETAGVEQYDVIEKIGGRAIRQPQDISQAIRDAKSDSVSIDIVRQAHRQSLNVDRAQLKQSKTFSFSRGEPSPSAITAKGYVRADDNVEFHTDTLTLKPGQPDSDRKLDPIERDREKADRDRERADRDREKADRDRQRTEERAQRDRDREAARRDIESQRRNVQASERDQLDAVRKQIQSQLEQQRGELDRARAQLDRARQEMEKRLNELRAKLDGEIRQKFEEEMHKGQDKLREKMDLLEQKSRDLKAEDLKDEQEKN